MSKYTTELRFICETKAGLTESAGYNDVDVIVLKAYPKIFNKFELFDENYRSILCTKILKHYYTREISEETTGLWLLRLNQKMSEIMPYYNALYKAWAIDFNPLHNVDMRRVHSLEKEQATTNEQSADTKTNGVERILYSDTPQGSLQNIENETYLTNATKDINAGESETDLKSNQLLTSTDDYIEHITGKGEGASFSKMLNEYKESLINIDLLIINELQTLFFNLW